MDFQTRFAIFTAVGVASFSAGLSLTTACQRVDMKPETVAQDIAPPAKAKPPVTEPRELAIRPTGATLPTPAQPAVDAKLSTMKPVAVRRLIVTQAIKDHEPVEPTSLAAGTPVLAFVELANPDAVERSVTVTFERPGHPAVGHVKLTVPAASPRFRTWARTRNLSEPGTWEAVVHGDDGSELGRMPFELSSRNELDVPPVS